MVISIILAQDKRMRRIEDALKRIKPPKVTQVEEKKPVEPAFNKPKPKTS
jgi:hypothetical protein